ncbi:MAG: hypothetical protein JSR73_09490 [Proteobacteria bacterium]|nr:hypothetical protein [Pseudomonadota bacterium]
MSTSFGFLSTSSWWGALAPVGINRYPTAPDAPPTVSQVNAFGAFSDAILSAFGKVAGSASATGADATGSATTPNRVGAVALALKQALEASNGSPDAVAGVLGKIQSALDAASQALASAGFSSDQIQAFTDQFKSALGAQLDALANQLNTAGAPAPSVAPPTLPSTAPATGTTDTGAAGSASGAGSGTATGTTAGTGSTGTDPATNPATTPAVSSGAFQVSYKLSASGALRLVTAEGDIVNISFRATEKGTAIGASAAGAAGIAAYAAISQTDSARFRISVQGSLNADELKAVNDVLGQVDALATQFFQGNVSDAFSSAASLNVDPTEIAGLSLRLNESARFSLTAIGDPTTTTPATTDTTGSTAGDTTATSTPPTTTATDPAATGATAASGTDPAAPPATTTPAATDPAATPAGSDTGSTLPSSATGGGTGGIFDFLRQVLDAIGTPTTAGSVTISAKAKLTLLASAVGNASLTPTEAGAADFLKRIFGALADTGTSGTGTSTSATAASGTPTTPSAAAA